MLKVFLAEDEFVIREGIKNNIDWKSNGYDFCGEAGDGELAFSMIRELKPDILITDIRMPFMDGLSLSKLVKKSLPETEIIVLSGYEEFDYAKESIKIGVARYLLKPINGDDLLREVNSVAQEILKKREEWTLLSSRRSTDDRRDDDNKNTDEFGDARLKRSDRKKIDEFLHTGSENECDSFIKNFIEEIGNEAMDSLIFRQYVAMDIYFIISDFVEDMDGDVAEINEYKDASKIIGSRKDTEEFIAAALKKAVSIRDKRSGGRNKDVIEKAMRYINDNYSDEELSLNTLSSYVGVSPNHLSALFTKETGETFIKYLTDRRMDKAKEMLKMTDKKTSDIAAAVGYRDSHYFSSLFKKTQGKTPTEYRAGKSADNK